MVKLFSPMRMLFLLTMLLPAISYSQDYDRLPYQKGKTQYNLQGWVLSVSEQTLAPPKDSSYYIDRKELAPDGTWSIQARKEIQFDSSGNLTALIAEEAGEKRSKFTRREKKLFYRKNRLVAFVIFEDKDRADSAAFHYKRNGLLEYYLLFNHRNKLQSKVTYTYDRDKQVSLVRKMDESNMPVSMIKYRYQGNELRQTQHFDDQFRHFETRNYSKQLSKDGSYNESYAVQQADGTMKEGISLVKDSKGNILEQSVVNSERQVTDYRKFRYDDQGNRIEEHFFSPEETKISERYQYDSRGNWTRKDVYKNDWLEAVVVRNIIYAG